LGVTDLGRWKMFDNLRRSLTPIAWFAASVLGWYWLDPLGALLWQMLLIFSLFVAPTLSLINGILPRSTDIVAKAHLHTVFNDLKDANAQVALRVVFIADTAYMMADAIARALYRLFVSRKLMLQWRTAASAQAVAQTTILGHYRVMWHAPVLALLALALAALPGGNAFLVGVPFALLWILSPAAAWYVSQSAETEDRLQVPEGVLAELRKIARRTWRYFDHFVVPAQHYLPPDNVQQTPHAVVAMRTSPTNIGVYLLSVVSARRFGWISFEEAVSRIEQTVETTDRLEKYRGHLFNWYHTDTLKWTAEISPGTSSPSRLHAAHGPTHPPRTWAGTRREWGTSPPFCANRLQNSPRTGSRPGRYRSVWTSSPSASKRRFPKPSRSASLPLPASKASLNWLRRSGSLPLI
jgi:cyclic beta-1,2-glucan synthetase